MAGKRVSTLCSGINTISVDGPDNEITGVAYDSKSVKPGFLFFALPGVHTDGHQFIDSACLNGARGVVYSRDLLRREEGIAYIRVKDTRKALSPVSSAFFDNPSRTMDVIGVTGTDGKSSTVYFIHQLLESCGINSGFLSTVHYLYDSDILANPYRQSTPEASEIHAILFKMLSHGKSAAVIEATSHGLSPKNNRLGDVNFNTAVFTNLSHEHLEFHGTFDQYRKDKTNLFSMLGKGNGNSSEPFGIINADDPSGFFFKAASIPPVYSYGIHAKETDLKASFIKPDSSGSEFTLSNGREAVKTRLNMPGLFNVENVLAAVLTVQKKTDLPLSFFGDLVPNLKPVPGRMQPIKKGQPFSVIVDYAHTPGSFGKLLPMMKKETQGKLIVLFGSAGERDFEKRSVQGEIASKWADIVILSDEDPRGEENILPDIAKGCASLKENEELFLIPDRREAIKKAFSLSKKGDTVLLLGKGHESTIIYKDGPVPWNEAEIAGELLSKWKQNHIGEG